MRKRLHLVEIGDLPFCPAPLRDGITDILQYSINANHYYAPAVPILARALAETDSTQIIDLCSGGGGPWPSIYADLNQETGRELSVRLTDLFPNEKAFEQIQSQLGNRVKGELSNISVFNVPESMHGFRTIFTGLHHFEPHQAQLILEDAIRKGEGIAIFEFTQRSWRGILPTLLAPLGPLLLSPIIKPFRWSRILLTYIIPILPIAVLYEGVISCIRTYSIEELQALIDQLPPHDYQWEIGEKQGSMFPLTYLVGYPRSRSGNLAQT